MGQFYHVNKTLDHTCTKGDAPGATSTSVPFGYIYPCQDPSRKLRDSNFMMPTNHVRTVLYISKQADSEFGEDKQYMSRGWTDSNPKVPYYYIYSGNAGARSTYNNFVNKQNQYGNDLTIVKKRDMNVKRIVGDYMFFSNNPQNFPAYGEVYFAKRLGFDVIGHTMPHCPESNGYFDQPNISPSQSGVWSDPNGRNLPNDDWSMHYVAQGAATAGHRYFTVCRPTRCEQ